MGPHVDGAGRGGLAPQLTRKLHGRGASPISTPGSQAARLVSRGLRDMRRMPPPGSAPSVDAGTAQNPHACGPPIVFLSASSFTHAARRQHHSAVPANAARSLFQRVLCPQSGKS